MLVTGEAGQLLSRRLRCDGRGAGAPFSFFIPRGPGWLELKVLVGAQMLSLRLERQPDARFALRERALEQHEFGGLGGRRAAAEKMAALASIALETHTQVLQGGEGKERMQQAFDPILEVLPVDQAPVFMLADYLEYYGPHQFFCEKLTMLLLRMRAFESCLRLCEAGLGHFAQSTALLQHRGEALIALSRLEEGFAQMAQAAMLVEHPDLAFHAATVGRRLTHGDFGMLPERPEMLARVLALAERAQRLAPDRPEVAMLLAGLYRQSGRVAAARDLLEHWAVERKHPQAATLRAQIALEDGAPDSAGHVLSLVEETDAVRLEKRALARYRAIEGLEAPQFVTEDGAGVGVPETLSPGAAFFAGAIALEHGPLALRRDLLKAGPLPEAAAARLLTIGAAPTSAALAPAQRTKRAVLISKKGAFAFGGAERFLLDAAQHYEAQGYSVAFIGWEPPSGHEGQDALAYPTHFIEPTLAQMRAKLLELSPDFVHAVSGALELTGEALRGFDIPLIKGIHFWSEVFEPAFLAEKRGYFSDAPQKIDRSFELLLYGPGPVYVNSVYLQAVFENQFGFSPAVIPSVSPQEGPRKPQTDLPADWTGYVLLLNGRADKGAWFVLDLAAQMPEQDFLIVCSQGNLAMMTAEVTRRALANVIVLDRREDVDALIDRAAVVLCPSFTFVETFGRIPVEALRRGTPVLMARQGNFPYLAPGSDLVLDEDLGQWAAKIRELAAQAPRAQLDAIIAPSARPAAFASGIGKVLRQTGRRIAACVGSGIGNCIHTAPAISLLARHFGAPIDVIVKGDFAANFEVFAQAEAVGSVFQLSEGAMAKPYEQVFVFDCFGPGPARFNAPKIHVSRAFEGFNPLGDEQEAVFNARFVAAMLGLRAPSTAEVAQDYFFADLKPASPRRGRIIGLHAGSKGGRWAAKRWPHFEALTRQLIRDGYEVRCFGGSDERVAGAADFTGGSLRESAAHMRECAVFLSNDSGFMNMAQALGIELVALFGPTTIASRGPIGARAQVLRAGLSCIPCELRGHKYETICAGATPECMSALGLEQVLAALRPHLA
ncbi:MAG: glycosyltransferase [Neomegalonema sp.]|nr:glycosyltransferase [Neomegalonema sp.]